MDFAFVKGTYYSIFSRQVVNSYGRIIETIERPGEMVATILQQTMNVAERVGSAYSFGCFNDRKCVVDVMTITTDGDATYNMTQAVASAT